MLLLLHLRLLLLLQCITCERAAVAGGAPGGTAAAVIAAESAPVAGGAPGGTAAAVVAARSAVIAGTAAGPAARGAALADVRGTVSVGDGVIAAAVAAAPQVGVESSVGAFDTKSPWLT